VRSAGLESISGPWEEDPQGGEDSPTNEARCLAHGKESWEEGLSGDPVPDLRCATPSGYGGMTPAVSPSCVIILTGRCPAQEPVFVPSPPTARAPTSRLSMLYAGIHYAFDNEEGRASGRCVGQAINERVRFTDEDDH
jgi:hypothetical protein